jgi:hypothetical protein
LNNVATFLIPSHKLIVREFNEFGIHDSYKYTNTWSIKNYAQPSESNISKLSSIFITETHQ